MRMRKSIKCAAFWAVSVITLLSSAAQAGFVSFSCETAHYWNFDGAIAQLDLSENLDMLGYDSVIMSGETDEDPTFHVTKTVTNETSITWTAYEMALIGSGVIFDYTNSLSTSSSHFQKIDRQPTVLTFSSPNIVPSGETVTLDFDINVSTTGLFSFTLQQSPVPEPATIALLGLGTLSLVPMKRKWQK